MSERLKALEKEWNEAAKDLCKKRDVLRVAEHERLVAAERHSKAKLAYVVEMDRLNGLARDDEDSE